MIYGGGDVAMRRERSAEPRHHGRGTADAVGEKNQREFFWGCDEVSVRSGFPGLAEWVIGRAYPLYLLDGGGVCGIPDVSDESVRLCAAPIVRFGRSELAVHHTDFIENALGSSCLGGALRNE